MFYTRFTHVLRTFTNVLPTFYELLHTLIFFTHVLPTSLFFTHVLPTLCCSTNLPWEIIGSWWRFSIQFLPTFYQRRTLGVKYFSPRFIFTHVLPTMYFYSDYRHCRAKTG